MEHSITGSRLPAGPQISASRLPLPELDGQFLEYAYYAAVFYGYMGEVLALPINSLGAGMIAALAILCTVKVGTRSIFTVAFGLPILFALSFIIVQTIVHGESLMDVRGTVVWMLTVIILSKL